MRNRFRNFMVRQFGKPSGLAGRLVGRRLTTGNVYDARWTVSLLNIDASSRVLEIGFGPGVSTQMAAQKAVDGLVAGIDHSTLMVQAASRRNARAIRAGRVDLREGDVGALPYPEARFDIAFSAHSIYFWPDPLAALKELRRVLKPGGLLAITIQPLPAWAKDRQHVPGMTLYFSNDVAEMFRAAGFRQIRIEQPPDPKHTDLECILGAK